MLPVVALVGRPNVGKSTVFNALTRSRDALVHDQPGVTRDRHYGVCRLDEIRPFMLVDTGGINDETEGLAHATTQQAQLAAREADVIVFVVDAREGNSSLDDEIMLQLRRHARPLLLLINKMDGMDEAQVCAEFARYGMAQPLTASAAHRRGIDELLEAIVRQLPPPDAAPLVEEDNQRLRIALVGRPNVGKSTLVNRLLGEERMIASPIPGTTRDSIAIDMQRDGRDYRLIDTAGLRRRSKVEAAVEKFSIIKTLRAIEESQVAVVLLDASEGVTDQDATILSAVLEAGRALVIAVNKWDGLSEYQRQQTQTLLSLKLGFVPWAQRVRISALHGSGLRELFTAIHRAHASATRNFTTGETNRALELAVAAHPPPAVRGHAAKLRYVHPGGSNPPTFVVHGTRLKDLPDSWRRYLENFFRQHFKLSGTPVHFVLRETVNPYAGKKNSLTPRQVASRKRLMRHIKSKNKK